MQVGEFAGDQVESAIGDKDASSKTGIGLNGGDYIYGSSKGTREHPDRYYRIDVEYEDPPSLNEIADIVQGIRSIRNIIKKKIPNVDMPTFPHRIIRKITVYQHYEEIHYRYRIPKGGLEEVRQVEVISHDWRIIANYQYGDSYYDFVTPRNQELWVRGRRMMGVVRENIINNPGSAKEYARRYPSPY
jgi:hypothetical protein